MNLLRRVHPLSLESTVMASLAVGLLCATSCLAEPPVGSADTSQACGPTRVRATGHATLLAEPDLAIVDLAVASEARQAGDAARANGERTAAVLDALRKAFGDAAEIETTGYALSPRYVFQKEGGRRLEGFTARSALRVKSRDVEAAGRIIDVAVASGAGEINGVRFGLRDDGPERERALALATRDARRRAEVMADALGLRVLRVLSLEQGVHSVVPLPQRARVMAMEAQSSATPIEAGGVEIRADATIEVEAGP